MIKTVFFEQLNENQRCAALNDIHSCTKITAGAGCGKTKVISSRFLKLAFDLIDAGVESPLEKILVITFTDKAANEMKERIYSTLRDAGIDYYSQNLWISTFHGFCSKILRKHSIEAGLAPNFKLGDEITLREIYDEIIEKIKNGQIGTGTAVESILSIENLRNLGSAGDLNEIFEDIFDVIKKIKSLGISPSEFLDAATRATKEFSRTVASLSIENWGRHLGDFADDTADFEETHKKIASKKLIIDKNGSQKPENWSYAEDFKKNAGEIERTELDLTRVIAEIYTLYDNELLKGSIIDFDDLINKTITIFKSNPEIREFYQSCFKHIIIDEFQDTNGAQLELIKLILDENHANITFVGDRKQSIYAFRHAQSENLEVLHQYIEEKYQTNYPEIPLNINYRSTGGVLDAVNCLTGGFLRLDEKLHPANPSLCVQENSAAEGAVATTILSDIEDAADLKIKQAKFIALEIASIKERENPKYSDFAILVNSHAEAEFIEKFLLREGIPTVKKDNTGFFKSPTVKDLTALLKLAHNKNDEQAFIRALKISLSDKEIYEIAKNLPEEHREEGKEKLNFAQKFHKSGLAYPNGIKETLDSINSIKCGERLTSVFNKLAANYSIKSRDDYAKYRHQLDLRTFEKIVENYENAHSNTSRAVYLGDFIKYLEKIAKDRDFELPNVATQGTDAVNISTIHASKGLEYDYVFVAAITSKTSRAERGNVIFDLAYGNKKGVGIVINKFKGKDTPKAALYKEIWKKPRERAEKLRLFYVAISRAKKYLNIISFEPIKGVGGMKPAEYLDVAPRRHQA